MNVLEEDSLEIYVDGSISQTSRNGGVGVRVLTIDSNGDEASYDFQLTGYLNVNSGQLEIIACTYALDIVIDHRLALGKKRATVFTDSKYVANNYKTAMFHWIGSRWLWKDGRPVLDASEWKQLVRRLQNYLKLGIYVDIQWVKGHNKSQHNIAVDKLARDILRLPAEAYSKNSVISIFRPEPTRSPKRLELGSVKMKGQRVSIKVLGIEYLQVHKLWSCKYQVVSTKSPYRGLVDKAFSRTSMDIGKSYYVRLNSSLDNPRIEKVYRQIQ